MEIAKLYELYKLSNYKVYTDTRTPIKGALFFALQGKGFNGNLFASRAIEQGASFVIVDQKIDSLPAEKTILCENVLKTLQDLANFYRKNSSAKIVAIGGSNGKTTSKELLNKVLSAKFKTHATPGNYNNHIGLPLTLLSMPRDTEIAIVEFGTNQKGDISELCHIAEPDFGVITNIGKEHLEGFGSEEAIAKEESSLFDFLLKMKGVPFINQDDKWLCSMSKRFLDFRFFSVSDFIVESSVPQIKLKSMSNVSYMSQLAGIHNISNIALARAIGVYFGVEENIISDSIANYSPTNMRSQWINHKENLIYMDAYNANPSSMEAALLVLKDLPNDKTKIAILGDMFELGDYSFTEHKSIYEMAKGLSIDKIFTVGKEFSKVNFSNTSFEETIDLKNYIEKNHIHNAYILLKGSRGMKLEEVLEKILKSN
jgi:UDP-N-acetylmuramoyl-tripeptide--D-alanyl-D-alanine ligase